MKKTPTIRRQFRASLAGGSASLAIMLAGTGAAHAQDAPVVDERPVPVPGEVVETDAVQGAEGDILVTASRAAPDGFNAPTPTTVIGAGTLEARGATNIATVLNEIPAFKASTTPTTVGVRAIFAGANFADMRGLGASRTLVLVDGNRFVPQISTGIAGSQVDLNQIPALMLERAEVVTGGGSAQWGSDAVAGVVNLILRKDFEGFKAEIQTGISDVGDYDEYRIGVIGGLPIGDRGNLTMALDYTRNDGIGDVYTRDWGREAWGLVANPCPASATSAAQCPRGGFGLARTLILPDVRNAAMTNGGLINNTTGPAAQLRGIEFLPGGELRRVTYGQFAGAQFMQGGDFNRGQNFNTGVSLASAMERWVGYARAGYEVADGFEVYAEGSYANSVGRGQTLPPRNETGATAINVALSNPFIPTALRAEIDRLNALPQNAANQITSFSVGRNNVDVGYQRTRIENETMRGAVGFDGELGPDWNLGGALIYGENTYVQNVAGNRVQRNFRFATDVVNNSAGQPVCRATLPGAAFNAAAAGCVPFNIFGRGAPSAAAIDYVTDTTFSQTDYSQFAANLNIDGEPFSTWAGPVGLAAGLEYRREEQNTVVDPIAAAGGYESSNAAPLEGSFDVKEGYLEVVVPLARDVFLLRSFDVQGAARYADYSTSGGVTTWKAGATWEPIEGLLVRGTISRDIRAPNLFELNTPPISTVLNRSFSTGLFGGPAGQVATENITRGNPDLRPEKATTKTIGFSYAPPFIDGLQFSVDYFNIKVEDAIALINPVETINICTGLTPSTNRQLFCDTITRLGGPGSVAEYRVDNPFLNIGMIARSGWDFEATYRLPLDLVSESIPGDLTLRFSGTLLEKWGEDITGTGFIDRAGEISAAGSPDLITNSSLTYDDDVYTLQLQMRTLSGGNYNNIFTEGVQINDNSVSGATYFNASATVRLTEQAEVFVVVNNLLDRDPELIPQNFGYPTVPQFFDTIGRYFRLGVRIALP